MAGKFCGSTSRLLVLSVAAFITLSVAVVTEDTHQCYWCGPLADQVHRSQRPPACDAPGNQVTDCEPGHSYCAIIATSPPYVESRYCVKKYQDECFTLYCNTTKTWKMTCPCKGNLCNGANTEREIEAFAILPKLVENAQSKRINKRTRQSVQFYLPRPTKTLIITNVSSSEGNMINSTVMDSSESSNEQLTLIVVSKESFKTDSNNLENLIASTEDMIPQENTRNEDTTVDDVNISNTNEMVKDMTTEEIKMTTEMLQEIITETLKEVPSEVVKEITTEAVKETTAEMVKEMTTEAVRETTADVVIEMATEPLQKLTTTLLETTAGIQLTANIQKETEVTQMDKPNQKEELPTAEALQQNASPVAVTERTEVPTTMTYESITTTTSKNNEKTTNHTKPSKNGAVYIKCSMLIFLFILLV